jgi:hypothetical protein
MTPRYRPSAGRMIVEIFYGSDHITRAGGVVSIDISQMSRKLHVRPVRLCETLEWCQKYGIVTGLSLGRKFATLVPVEPEWKKKKVWNGE